MPAHAPELISPVIRTEFREFCVSRLVLRQIDDIFRMAEIRAGYIPADRVVPGQRRTLVERYYASLNWRDPDDADRFVRALGYALVQTYLSEEDKAALRRMCTSEGLIVDDGTMRVRIGSSRGSDGSTASPPVHGQLEEQLLALGSLEEHQRGYCFEKLLAELFGACSLAPRESFRLIGEQIDGSFELAGDVYLVEAKWQARPTAQNDLLVFREKVESKSSWSRGLFISYSGYTPDGITAFSRGRATNIIGMTGQDLFFVLSGEMALVDAIRRKARRAAETGEFYVSVDELLRGSR
ncbi:MAG: hypothetical protein GX557_16225 [Chloroflexi bacterium]|nr:hypothetical protein [Chloroflexota bacterium]